MLDNEFPEKEYEFFEAGELAQLARAPALHAGGQGFDSLILHHCPPKLYAKVGAFREGDKVGNRFLSTYVKTSADAESSLTCWKKV